MEAVGANNHSETNKYLELLPKNNNDDMLSDLNLKNIYA
jgi:hypothetical protein